MSNAVARFGLGSSGDSFAVRDWWMPTDRRALDGADGSGGARPWGLTSHEPYRA